jgi:hypothetical protein
VADEPLRPAAVVDRVVGLHARNDTELRESRDVGRGNVLGVLDAKATVTRSVLAGDVTEDVELEADGPVTDCMDDDMEAGGVGALRPSTQVLGRVDEQPGVAGRIGERLEQRRRVGAKGSVDESLEPADAQPLVTAPAGRHRVAETLPRIERHRRVDACTQASRAVGTLEHREVAPAAHVVNRGHPAREHVPHRGVERAIRHLIARRRLDA